MTVSINGATRQFPELVSVAALIGEMGLAGKCIALERNGEILPRGMFATQYLVDGDRLEVVVAVVNHLPSKVDGNRITIKLTGRYQ